MRVGGNGGISTNQVHCLMRRVIGRVQDGHWGQYGAGSHVNIIVASLMEALMVDAIVVSWPVIVAD